MNASTRRILASLVLAAGTTLGTWSPSCHAQSEPPRQNEKDPATATRVAPVTISLKFAGGTVADYVKAVQAQRAGKDNPVNVILSPGVERIAVNPIEFNLVSVDTAMRLLERVAEVPPGQLRAERISGDAMSSTFAINQRSADRTSSEQELEVLSIAQLTNPTVDGVARPELAIKPDVILSAVELALPTGEEPARVKYHEESRLLILQGSPRATNAVHQVIKTMIDDQRQRLGDAGVSLRQMIESKARVERSQIQVNRKEAELAALQAKLDRLSKLAQQGNVSDTEVQEARSQVDQAEASLLTARSELQEATALAELLAKSSVAARPDNTSGELASLRKLVEEQAAQIKALNDELNALRKQKNTK